MRNSVILFDMHQQWNYLMWLRVLLHQWNSWNLKSNQIKYTVTNLAWLWDFPSRKGTEGDLRQKAVNRRKGLMRSRRQGLRRQIGRWLRMADAILVLCQTPLPARQSEWRIMEISGSCLSRFESQQRRPNLCKSSPANHHTVHHQFGDMGRKMEMEVQLHVDGTLRQFIGDSEDSEGVIGGWQGLVRLNGRHNGRCLGRDRGRRGGSWMGDFGTSVGQSTAAAAPVSLPNA